MSQLVCLDFETYYAPKLRYSLKVMPVEAYILDKQFQVHGCAVMFNGINVFMTHHEFIRWADAQDWSKIISLSHNAKFDAAILAWRYKKIAGLYVDTLGLANAFIRPFTGRSDLNACSTHLGLPLKSNALKEVEGLRTDEILQRPGLWERLVAYALQDNVKAHAVFKKYWMRMLPAERLKQHWSVINYIKPKLDLDPVVLAENLGEVQMERDRLLAETGLTDPALLRSPKKFAAILEELGVEVEYKSGKVEDIPAVSRKDPQMERLLAHPDAAVVSMAKARLAFGSSLEVTRTRRFMAMASVTRNTMLAPYNYHAAHTGRPGGSDGMNLTNLAHGSKLRKAIKAPKRKIIVEADASQIECRFVAYLTKCLLLTNTFSNGEDPYCNFGFNVFGRVITKADVAERQSMKVCVLSLQYGVGPETLQNRLRNDGYPTLIEKAIHYVRVYRSSCSEVLASGAEGVNLLKRAVKTRQTIPWRWGILFSPEGIRLPSTRWLLYRDLCLQGNELVYYSPRYKSWQKLYPGSFNENIAQAMANDHVGDTHVKPMFFDKVALHNYDALSLVVPEEEAEYWKAELVASLSTPPWWAPHVTLGAEGKIKQTFGG